MKCYSSKIIVRVSLMTLVFFLILANTLFSKERNTLGIFDFEGLGISETNTKSLTNRFRGNLVKAGV